MPQPSEPTHPRGPAVSRRTWLLGLGGAAGVLALNACTTPPPGGSTPTGTSSPSARRGGSAAPSPAAPALVPGAAAAITIETRLCATAEGILAKSGKSGPSSRQRTVLSQIRDAHLDHLRGLGADPRQPLPGTPAAPRAAKVPADLDDAIRSLIAAEAAASRQHRGQIGTAAQDLALVWASLSTAADSYAAALGSDVARSGTALGRQRRPAAAQTQLQALSALLAQIHGALYGYQTAVAKLSGDSATTALNRITSYYQFRDRLTAQIVALKGTPPAAEPAYVLSPPPTSGSSAGRVIAGMETRIQPFLGQWIAVSSGSERTRAAASLTSTARVALRWGGALNRWPGWA